MGALGYLLALACCARGPGPAPPPGLTRPWTCTPTACIQRYPAFPDDGEWECADVQGVIVCRGGGPAAGVVAGPPAAGWVCGVRGGSGEGGRGERICVAERVELPGGEARGWRCLFEHSPEQRICRRDPAAPAVGAPCAGGCVEGTRCQEDRCLPPPPEPGCWLDPDCPAGERCRFGSCRS